MTNRRYDEKWFEERSKSIHGEKYTYDLVKYKNNTTPVELICNACKNVFNIVPAEHFRRKRGCYYCSPRTEKFKKFSSEDFVQRSINIFGSRFDYSRIKYTNIYTDLELTCKKHENTFSLQPALHLQYDSGGCVYCLAEIKKKSSETKINKYKCEWIDKANRIHENKFDYSEVNYQGRLVPVQIRCKEHNIKFMQLPCTHITFEAAACPLCSRTIRNFDDFKVIVEHTRKGKFRFYPEYWDHSSKKTKIHCCCCQKDFWAKPARFVDPKSGCYYCSKHVSKPEAAWLDSLNIPNDAKHRQVWIPFVKFKRKGTKVDGYDPITNTVFLFHGDFWHGNPSKFPLSGTNSITKTTYSYLYAKTLETEKILRHIGYKVVAMWESDFNKEVYG